jgi:hypothetical protein
MLTKLTELYKDTIISSTSPHHDTTSNYYWFQDPGNHEWVGISKSSISQSELLLLKALFDYKEIETGKINHSIEAEKWYKFLFMNGNPPKSNSEFVSIIQFSYTGKEIIPFEFETALAGFFSKKIMIVWIDSFNGLIIEGNQPPIKTDFVSIVQTLESEFFIKPYFYVGNPLSILNQLPSIFKAERKLFEQGRKQIPKERVFGFEKVFPTLVTSSLQEELQSHLMREIFPIFSEDPEMLQTLKSFLENNLNVTVTSKKLYIHRNTLQYRLDKFIEKTGINLKNFQGAWTVYLACLLFENQNIEHNA